MSLKSVLEAIVIPGQQRYAMVCCYPSKHAHAGQLIGEQVTVIFLNFIDFFLLSGGNTISSLRGATQSERSLKFYTFSRCKNI